jgi:hypothetical protein
MPTPGLMPMPQAGLMPTPQAGYRPVPRPYREREAGRAAPPQSLTAAQEMQARLDPAPPHTDSH